MIQLTDLKNKAMQFIIYDGDCGFCNKTIMFLAKKDKNNIYKFVSSYSTVGSKILAKYDIIGLEKSTIILFTDNRFFTKSDAIKRILIKIPPYNILGIIISIFPLRLSNIVYDFISQRRKYIIKNNACKIPTEEIRKKFIL